MVCLIYTERSVNCLFQSAGIINSTTKLTSSLHGQNVCHFADDIFKFIFMNEEFCILICISLFVHKGPINNKSALVRVIGGKPLPEPVLTQFTDVYMQHQGEISYTHPCTNGLLQDISNCIANVLGLTWFYIKLSVWMLTNLNVRF